MGDVVKIGEGWKPTERQPAAAICPRCKRGGKVTNTYWLGGVEHPDDYCGVCGKNWPKEANA